MNKYFKVSIILGSIAMGSYSVIAYLFFTPGKFVHPDMQESFKQYRFILFIHVFCSALTLLLGPFQFSERLRKKNMSLHRIIGKVYLGLGVFLGGLSGLYISQFAFGGLISKIGFSLLSLSWIASGCYAYLAVRAKKIEKHKSWMIRNYSLSLAAFSLRLELPIFILMGFEFINAYQIVSWLSWVLNLLIAEFLIIRPNEAK